MQIACCHLAAKRRVHGSVDMLCGRWTHRPKQSNKYCRHSFVSWQDFFQSFLLSTTDLCLFQAVIPQPMAIIWIFQLSV